MPQLCKDEVQAIEDFLGESAETGIYWKTAGAIRKLYEDYKLQQRTWGTGGSCAVTTTVGAGFPAEGLSVKDRGGCGYGSVNPYDLDALMCQQGNDEKR